MTAATAVIIERIGAALAAGELKRVPDSARFAPLGSVADLLRPWEEMFPGVELNEGGDTRDVFTGGGLRKPQMVPQVRRSRRPLPPPRPIAASPRTVSPGLFASVRAIWEFYRDKGTDAPALLAGAFTTDGMQLFVDPLVQGLSDWYPLGIFLEDLSNMDVAECHDLQLMLPHYTYDDEAAGAVEAFLSDAETLAGYLHHSLEERQTDAVQLPAKDTKIIEETGFVPLVQAYAAYRGEKSCDLARLFNWYPEFFGAITERYPRHMETDWAVISGDGGRENEMTITGKNDICFALAYAEAYQIMCDAMPDPFSLENNDGGECETFIHEVCEVWRRVHGKKPVKWTSPKSQTLAQRFRKGEL